MFVTEQIVVDLPSNVVFSYIDSGPPGTSSSYETIVLIHGNSFSNAIFKRLLPLSVEFNIRVVAPSRRGFAGSTPFHPAERHFLTEDEQAQSSASDEAKTKFHEIRGIEILKFLDAFIQRAGIPAIDVHTSSEPDSSQSVKGGIALVGWSLGSTFSLSAIANVDSAMISNETRNRLGQFLRAHILLEPALSSIGLPFKAWLPMRDPNIPAHARGPLFCQIISGYFDYAEETLTTRDHLKALNNVVPSISRVPTVFTFSTDEHEEIVTLTPESSADLFYSRVLQQQLRDTYTKACYDKVLKNNVALRNIRGRVTWEIAGTRSYGVTWPTFWEIEKDDIKAGEGEKGRYIRFEVMEGANHFMHWDEPEMTMKVFRKILDADV